MKIKGITIEPPKPKVLVIPQNGKDLVFTAQYVDNYHEFDKLCPTPTPVKIRKADGTESVDSKDAGYLRELDEWSRKRTNWLFLKSLEATEGLEWDMIDMTDSNTWLLLDEELNKSGLSQLIQQRLKMLVFEANGLDQSKIDEATERFLAGQAQESKSE
jgi:hypothetical protein